MTRNEGFWSSVIISLFLGFVIGVLLIINIFHSLSPAKVPTCPAGEVWATGQTLAQPDVTLSGCYPQGTFGVPQP